MDLTKISRKIAFLLRHNKNFIDEHGWADVDAVVKEIQTVYPKFQNIHLQQIVQTDSKGRYAYDESGLKIRANQGHSVTVDIGFKKLSPPDILYHGTSKRFLPSIRREGLNGQGRLYVHLSPNVETALCVGKRHGKPAVLQIHSKKMQEDGYDFYLSENHVWMTRYVPPEYFEPIEANA